MEGLGLAVETPLQLASDAIDATNLDIATCLKATVMHTQCLFSMAFGCD